MSQRSRTLLVGGIIAVAIVGVVAVGLIFINFDTQDDSSGSPSPAPSPTKGDPAAEVERAYLRFWEVWTEANLKLDPELMKQVATGEALRVLTEQIEEQRAKNQPVRISVEHHYDTLLTGPDTASVEDRYVNHSVRLNPATMQPIEADAGIEIRASHSLRRTDRQWHVAEIIEYR